ncbi:MAG: 55.9 kDa viroplasmin with coiled-coil domain [Plant associated soymovirus 1]|nr:MAG: 55.9 kDa viroplasmin with coiled-coil domain [Plant associated soymovirus 1]
MESKQEVEKRIQVLELSLKRLYSRIDEVHDELDQLKNQLKNFEGGEDREQQNKNDDKKPMETDPVSQTLPQKTTVPVVNPTTPSTPLTKSATPAEPSLPKYTTEQKAKSVLITGTPFATKPAEPQKLSPAQDEVDPRKKYYVIFNGPNAGIYKDWHIANSYIQGRQVTHKSYPTYVEAQKAFDESRPTWAKAAAKLPQPNEQIRKMVNLNPRARDIISNIPTRQSILEQRKPKANEFTAMWASIVEWTEEEGVTSGFYPSERISPKAVFIQGSSPALVYKYWINGLTDTIYLSDNLKEIGDFPQRYIEAVTNFRRFAAKEKPLFISSFSSYPAFNEDGTLCVPSICIDKIGVFNGDYIPRGEPQYTELTDELYVYRLCQVFDESRKITFSKKFKVNYVGPHNIVYSLAGREPSPEMLKHFLRIEEPFLNLGGIFRNFPEADRRLICKEMKTVKDHNCSLCNEEAKEEDEVIIDDDCSDANEHLEKTLA